MNCQKMILFVTGAKVTVCPRVMPLPGSLHMAIVDADTPIPSKASFHYLFYNRMSVSIELGVEQIHHTTVA